MAPQQEPRMRWWRAGAGPGGRIQLAAGGEERGEKEVVSSAAPVVPSGEQQGPATEEEQGESRTQQGIGGEQGNNNNNNTDVYSSGVVAEQKEVEGMGEPAGCDDCSKERVHECGDLGQDLGQELGQDLGQELGQEHRLVPAEEAVKKLLAELVDKVQQMDLGGGLENTGQMKAGSEATDFEVDLQEETEGNVTKNNDQNVSEVEHKESESEHENQVAEDLEKVSEVDSVGEAPAAAVPGPAAGHVADKQERLQMYLNFVKLWLEVEEGEEAAKRKEANLAWREVSGGEEAEYWGRLADLTARRRRRQLGIEPADLGPGGSEFLCYGTLDSVQVAGSFNQWQPVPLVEEPEGVWRVVLALPAGRHLYKYIVDGEWIVDQGKEVVSDSEGHENNQLVVGDSISDTLREIAEERARLAPLLQAPWCPTGAGLGLCPATT